LVNADDTGSRYRPAGRTPRIRELITGRYPGGARVSAPENRHRQITK
jgi:hypothetical protein